MRLLFISYELPPIGGGGGRAAWQIARRLARRGHQVVVLTSRVADLPAEECCEGVRILRLSVRRARPESCSNRELLSFMLRSAMAVRSVSDANRAEAVCAFFAIPGGPAAWWLRRWRGVPYVLSLRGSDIPRPELAAHQPLHRWTGPALRRILRGAASVTAVSAALRDAARRVADVPIHVIPNGVDTEWFRPSEGGCEASGRRILFVGRLQEFKGAQHLLAALPRIERAVGAPVTLTFAGDGPMRPALEAQARALKETGLASQVVFAGWLTQERVREVYAASSVLALPSLVEGHPNVLLEAMASGLPCVAADAPGIRDAVSPDTVRLVPPGDPDAIAAAVAAILRDPETRRAMGRAARACALSFSWDTVCDRYEDLMRQAVGKEGKA